MTLSTYQEQTALLLSDLNFIYNTKSQITGFINLARRTCARQSGCIMRVITGQSAWGASAQPGAAIPGGAQPGALPGAFPLAQANTSYNGFQTITGLERYPYQGFANPYLQQQHQGCKAVIDVASLSVSWGGSVRPTLIWMPWEDLQAYARSFNVPTESYPSVWSVLNPGENGEVYLFPVPSQPCEMEWLVYAVPSDLNTDDDYDAIPDGMKNAIQFGAAMWAYLSRKQFQNAEIMKGEFYASMGVTTVAADRGKIPNPYWGNFS